MREQIERLIKELVQCKSRAVLQYEECRIDPDAQIEASRYLGKRLAYNGCITRLQDLLADSQPVSGEIDTRDRV